MFGKRRRRVELHLVERIRIVERTIIGRMRFHEGNHQNERIALMFLDEVARMFSRTLVAITRSADCSRLLSRIVRSVCPAQGLLKSDNLRNPRDHRWKCNARIPAEQACPPKPRRRRARPRQGAICRCKRSDNPGLALAPGKHETADRAARCCACTR